MAESGKTTLLKQMKILSGNGYTEEERRSYTKLVFQNILQSMIAMTNAMRTLRIPYFNPRNEVIKRPSVFLKQFLSHQQSYGICSFNKMVTTISSFL